MLISFNEEKVIYFLLSTNMLITNFKKYIVILDATTKYRDMYFVEWAEKPAAHDMVKKFVSGIPNTHCGMGLNS